MDNNELQNTLGTEFAKKRLAAENVAAKNLSSAMKNKNFAKLFELEKETSFELSKASFLKSKDAKILKETLSKIKDEQKKILAGMNLAPEDLLPKYECKICGDTGMVNGASCKCFTKRKNELLIEQCGLKKSELTRFSDFDEKIFSDEKQRREAEKLKDLLSTWCNKFPNVKKFQIVLSGETGVGKTFFAKCAASALMDRNFSVCFVSSFEMNNMMLKYHTTFDSQKLNILVPLMESDLLIVDDLGTEPIINNVTLNYLFLVISERERFGKATIFTTNLDAEGILVRYGERIYSRLADKSIGTMLALHGNDLRTQK